MAAKEATEQSKVTSKQLAAELYRKNSELQQNHANHLLKMIHVPNGGLVLDLGCGTGYFATVLSDLVGPEGKVVAVDPDVERIKIAKERNSRPNIDYFVADDQSFPGEGYDLIVAIHVIHWIKDKDNLFKNLFKKLVQCNGLFAFVTYNGTPENPQIISKAMHDLISSDFEDNLYKKKAALEKVDTYQLLAQPAGFKVDSIEIFNWDTWFKDTNHFLDFWAGITHGDFTIDSIDKQKLQEFKTKHEQELKATPASYVVLCMVIRKD